MVNIPRAIGACGGPVKLFVRGLPKSLTTDDILGIFQQYGGVEEVFIMKDRETQESRGLAFVRFRDLSEGQSAIAALNGKILPESGRPLTVIYAQGEADRLGLPKEAPGTRSQDTKLYVSGLGPSTEAAELRNIFEPFGRVTEVHVPGPHALYAFVRFTDEKDASRAISEVSGRVQVEGSQRALEVKLADPSSRGPVARRSTNTLPPPSSYGGLSPASNGYDHNPSQGQPRFVNAAAYGQTPPAAPDSGAQGQQPRTIGAWTEYFAMDGTPYYHNSQSNTVQWELPIEFKNPTAAHTAPQAKGPAGANIFVFSVPDAWTETDLRQHFDQFGRIISAKVVVDKQTGMSRGYGFISFDNCDAAARAVRGIMSGLGGRVTRPRLCSEESFEAVKCSLPVFQVSTMDGYVTPVETAGGGAGLDLRCDTKLLSFNLNNSNVPINVCLPPEDSDIIGRTIRRLGMWPQCEDLVHWWRAHLAIGGIFVDAGAHIGACSLHLGLSGLPDEVIAVEPNPAAGFYFEQSFAMNPELRERIQLHHAGVDNEVSTRHGQFAISHMAAGHLHGGYVQQRTWDLADPTKDVFVSYQSLTTTLDNLIPEGKRITLLKIDVEGFELRALQGARRLLSERRIDGIFFELNSIALWYSNTTVVELANYLLSFGYLLYDATQAADAEALGRAQLIRRVTCGLLDVPPWEKSVTGILFDMFARLGTTELQVVEPIPEECPWERLWCWDRGAEELKENCCTADQSKTSGCWDETYTRQRCCGNDPFYYPIAHPSSDLVFDPSTSM
ncbi:hypothetical protein FOL47_007336 [Perkinsus chesapeaki]|uniref:Uncharacterized protein n=1 Tax=Perkinsus chesapeaki TaxID=330153 RepID=A0A7J6MVU7_PERCH|nr:hypothetical protein FOL47_007336 [Perkinsus chesapeaki]